MVVRHRVPLLVLALLSVGEGAALAQNESPGAPYLEAATDAYQRLEYDQARVGFAKALELDPHLTRAKFMLGITDARLGHCRLAIVEITTSYEQADGEQAIIRDRCKKMVDWGTGAVEITTDPPGAEVRIDKAESAPAGDTPMRKELLAGRHILFLRKKGMEDLQSEFIAVGGDTVAVNLAMFPPVKAEQGESSSHTGLIVGLVVAGVVVVGAGLGIALPFALAHENPPMDSVLGNIDLRN